VPSHVGKCLLDDAERRRLDRFMEMLAADVFHHFHRIPGALGLAVGVPGHGGAETEIVEHARTQLERQRAHASESVVDESNAVGDDCRFPLQRMQALQIDLDRGEQLPDVVVKNAGDTAALVFPPRQHAPGESRTCCLTAIEPRAHQCGRENTQCGEQYDLREIRRTEQEFGGEPGVRAR
jgi:hypothetical protein